MLSSTSRPLRLERGRFYHLNLSEVIRKDTNIYVYIYIYIYMPNLKESVE